jgi:DnaJ-class molecular chaperone
MTRAKGSSEEVYHETAFEFCYSCNGSGLHYTGDDIVNCYSCKGDGLVRARDSKGRFTKVRLPD